MNSHFVEYLANVKQYIAILKSWLNLHVSHPLRLARVPCGAPGHPGARLEGAGVLLGRFRLRGVAESEDRDLAAMAAMDFDGDF